MRYLIRYFIIYVWGTFSICGCAKTPNQTEDIPVEKKQETAQVSVPEVKSISPGTDTSLDVHSPGSPPDAVIKNREDNSPSSAALTEILLPPDDTIQIPAGYSVLAQTRGDLDKDNVPELVTVFNFHKKQSADEELYRELRIYRAEEGTWKLWKKTRGGLLASDSGGMWGDPFDSIKVKRGALVIVHYGGAGDRWGITHRFRFQSGAFRLIGATVDSSTSADDGNQITETLDINLSTGKAVYTRKTAGSGVDASGDREAPVRRQFSYTRAPLPSIDSVHPGETTVEIPEKETGMSY